jgi:hypothetical protein
MSLSWIGETAVSLSLPYEKVFARELKAVQLAEGITHERLVGLTNEMIDEMLALITGCTDADVVYMPVDPEAHDEHARGEAQVEPWTLGHVIVHATASSEEACFIACELARGVEFHGRSRSEVPWETITTIAQCRARLEESRRMRLALLNAWPDQPHLDNRYEVWPKGPVTNAIERVIVGLVHDSDHVGQIAKIVAQRQRSSDLR